MKILVLAEINNGELAEDQTSKTVSAASTLGKVDVLCASSQCSDASTNITKMENVENVLVLEDELFAESLAESYSEWFNVIMHIVCGNNQNGSVSTHS